MIEVSQINNRNRKIHNTKHTTLVCTPEIEIHNYSQPISEIEKTIDVDIQNKVNNGNKTLDRGRRYLWTGHCIIMSSFQSPYKAIALMSYKNT